MEKLPTHLNFKNGKEFFPKIRPILEAGEAIVLLDESDIKEDKFCKRIIILNTGEMLAKEIVTERIRENMYPSTKETFMQYLNIYDNMADEIHWGIRYVFSFDSIDSNQIPGWLVAEVVEYKLTE